MKIRVMKRYHIPIIVVALVLSSILLSGCNGTSPSEPKASDYQAKIDELEKQVAALEKQITEKTTQTQILNKDVVEVVYLGSNLEVKDRQTLKLQLSSGDIVEGTVSVTSGTGEFISSVKDPFGNTLLQSKTNTYSNYITNSTGGFWRTQVNSTQVYPWKFSFIATTTGDFTLEVTKDQQAGTAIVISNAHLRVVVNP